MSLSDVGVSGISDISGFLLLFYGLLPIFSLM
jgi:hypothetical protein